MYGSVTRDITLQRPEGSVDAQIAALESRIVYVVFSRLVPVRPFAQPYVRADLGAYEEHVTHHGQGRGRDTGRPQIV